MLFVDVSILLRPSWSCVVGEGPLAQNHEHHTIVATFREQSCEGCH